MRLLILSLILTSLVATAQIPNSDFENWTNAGAYYNPDSWDTFNDTTGLAGVYTCTRGNSGTSGNYYIQLTTSVIPIIGTVVPGIAVCGTIDPATLAPGTGFPFTGRPQFLTGDWKYVPTAGDQGFVAALLTRWNPVLMVKDTIAALISPLQGSQPSWTPMVLPFTYLSNQYPDTALIVLASSGASGATVSANSYLHVDNLSFTGSVSEISTVPAEKFYTYPNPVRDYAFINSNTDKSCAVFVSDVSGKILQSSIVIPEDGLIKISLQSLPTGNYTLLVSDGSSQTQTRIIKIN